MSEDVEIEQPISELLEIAQDKSRKLTPRERRRVLVFIDDGGVQDVNGVVKQMSNYELAALFGVDEKIIRLDRKKLLKQYSAAITPEDAMAYVGEYIKEHDGLIRRAYQGLKASPDGTMAHQNYLKIVSDLSKRKVAMLQEIGVIPKELGNLNVNEELWSAWVADDGKGNATSGVKQTALPRKLLEDASDDDDDDEFIEATIV